jgi:uncharacterized protein
VDPAWQPFCGERCKLADLGRWLSEDYRVPTGGGADTPAAGPDSPKDPQDDDT